MERDRKSIWIFSTLYLMGLSIYMLKGLVGVSFPFLNTQFNFSPIQLGNIAASFFWTYSISFLLLGVVTRKIGVKKHAVITFIGMGICEILFATSSSYSLFILIKAVEGVMAAGFFLCSASIICALYTKEESKQIQAYQISSIGVSSLFIAVLYFSESKGFSIQVASYLSAVNAVFAFICILILSTTNNNYNTCFIILSILIICSLITIIPIRKSDELRELKIGEV